jgi:hypothetical protein
MNPFEEKMPRLVAALHAQFSSHLSLWERPGEGACVSAKLEHLSAEALAKVEAIKTNLRGLGHELHPTNQSP